MCKFVSTYRYIKLRPICGKFGKLYCPILAFVCYHVNSDTYKSNIDMSIFILEIISGVLISFTFRYIYISYKIQSLYIHA